MTSSAKATTITRGMRLNDFASVDLTVEGTASGGMGLVVWGPNAARGGQMKALKLLRPDRLAEAAAISPEARAESERQFEEEALVWCHLWSHQSVIAANALTRLPELGDLSVLELEYAPNGSLRQQLQLAKQQRSPLSLQAALAWALHIAAALAHLHQGDATHNRAALTRLLPLDAAQNTPMATDEVSPALPAPLVHCDLKPENVLLDEHGWAQLTDLGLTRAYATLDAQVATATATGIGQPGQTARQPAAQAHADEVARLRAVLQQAGQLPMPAIDHTALLATRTLRVSPTQEFAPGAASGVGSTARIGSRGPVAGSLPYMAPEQWLGLDATTPATDLYAFGVLLFELFAGYAAPFPYPRDPTLYLTPALYAHALLTGGNPLALAWHAAHTRRPLPAGVTAEAATPAVTLHRLTDIAQQAAALSSGPCAELAARGESGRAAACLEQLGALVEACLALRPEDRPSATQVIERLEALVVDPCGLEPLQIPEPEPHTPQNEGIFWANLGVTYSQLGRESEAIAAKRQALKHIPAHPSFWVNLGVSLDNLGGRERQHAQEAEAAGQAAEAARLRARARAHWEEALDAYQQAQQRLTPEYIQENPARLVMLANNEANTLAHLERYAEAVAATERALTLNPHNSVTRFNLALNLTLWSQEAGTSETERVARLERAQREISEVLDAAPELSDGRALAARIARALADPAYRLRR